MAIKIFQYFKITFSGTINITPKYLRAFHFNFELLTLELSDFRNKNLNFLRTFFFSEIEEMKEATLAVWFERLMKRD